MLAAKDCRKLDRLVDPPVPPKSVISALKLVCNEVSAELVAVLLAEPVDAPATDWIRLWMSAAN